MVQPPKLEERELLNLQVPQATPNIEGVVLRNTVQARLRSFVFDKARVELYRTAPPAKGASPRPAIGEYQYKDFSDSVPATFNTELGGTAVDQLSLGPVTYTDRNGNAVTVDKVVIDDAIISIGLQKTIVMSLPVAGTSTVKEWIADGDWAITISCRSWSQANYPIEKQKRFAALFRCNIAIPVQSRFLQDYGITQLVISNPGVSQEEGSPFSFPVEIQAYSDSPDDVLQLSRV